MEHRDGFQSSLKSTVWRLRIIAGAFVLLGLVFAQRSGRIVGDTKAGLVLNPGDYLATALSIWDPIGSWGQVQNQAYGYLWPMGPFFWVGDFIGLPEWVIQRLWWFVMLFTAYLGMIVLLNALRLGRPWVHILAGFAFALSPRMLSTIGPTSIEVWPLAVAPWVLAPLVLAVTSKRDPKWMAALSALAVAMVGGVNAAATFAVIPAAAIWILTAASGRTRTRLMIWWPIFVLMGTLWWIIPLFVLGSVSPPFLDFIEGAQATHAVTTLADALRGTSHWVTYIDSTSQAGSALIRDPLVMMNSFVVLGLGLAGLVFAPRRLRSFLWTSLLVGLFLVTAGFEGNAFSDSIRSLLDGVLAPLRNSHKFDPVIRIVLVIGIVALIDAMPSPKGVRLTARRGVAILAGAAVIGSTFPAWTGLLPNYGTYQEVPKYWYSAANWLNKQENEGNVFILPGAIVAEHLWGSPKDEVFESMLERPWTVRMANPLVPPANIKTIDEIERLFGLGRGSNELSQALVNLNVRYLVVRADLNTRSPSNNFLNALSTIANMEGVREVKSFGPEIGLGALYTEPNGIRAIPNYGQTGTSKAIRIFELSGTKVAASAKVTDIPLVMGDPSVLFWPGLSEPNSATIFEGDITPELPVSEMPLVVTDTNIRREASFGRVIDNRSASMTADEGYALKRRVHDFEVGGTKSVRRLVGAKSITASSSSSQVNAAPIRTDQSPWAAFDGDPASAWTANPARKDTKAWIRVEFDKKIDLSGSKIRINSISKAKKIWVETEQGVKTAEVFPGATTDLEIDGQSSRFLKITGETYGLAPFSIHEIVIPNAQLSRPLVLPKPDESWNEPSAVLLQAERPKSSCIQVNGYWRCTPESYSLGEDFLTIDRIIQLNNPLTLPASLIVEPLATSDLDIALSGELKIQTSSRIAKSPSVGPLAMLDGNNGSGWIAGIKDERPTINLQLPERINVNELSLYTDTRLPASYPTKVRLTFDDGERREVQLDPFGKANFAGKETSSLRLTVLESRIRFTRLNSGERRELPVGVSELLINNSQFGLNPDEKISLPCGAGPTVEFNGARLETSLKTSIENAVNAAPVEAVICGDQNANLTAGENRITAVASKTHRVSQISFGEVPAVKTSRAMLARTSSSLSVESLVEKDDLVFVAQNFNRGWVSGDSGAIAVNGWMQGWKTDSVRASFKLDRVYKAGVIFGAILVLGLLLMNLKYSRTRPMVSETSNRYAPMKAVPFIGAVFLPFIVGWFGLASFVIAFLAASLSRKLAWTTAIFSWFIVATTYLFVAFTDAENWAGSYVWLQWVASVCIGALLALSMERNEKFLKRMIGFSIKR